jgi:hypothetical protein
MLKIGMAALSLMMAGGISQAADAPTLTGTWTGSGQGAGKEEGWTTGSLTLEITEQRGPAFIGNKIFDNQDQRDPFWGAVAADGRTVHIVDSDGHARRF